jgi:hypothetical protein
MDKLGEATVPALCYSSEEVEVIELYMRTLTVQAKEAAKPVDSEMHRAVRRIAKAQLA